MNYVLCSSCNVINFLPKFALLETEVLLYWLGRWSITKTARLIKTLDFMSDYRIEL